MSRAHLDHMTATLGDLLAMTYTDSKGKKQHVLRGRTGQAVLHKYADRANKYTGRAWPSIRTLADELNLDPSNVQKAVEALKAGGLLSETGDREGQAKVYLVFPGQVTLETRRGVGADTNTSAAGEGAGVGQGVGQGVGVGVGVDTYTSRDDDDDEKPSAARVSGEISRENRAFGERGTRTPNPNQNPDWLDSPGKAAAGGKEKERLETVVAEAWQLDQVKPLTVPAAQVKRRKAIERAASEVLKEYPAASVEALRDLVLCRVHDKQPDRDLVLYLDQQQATVEGLVASDYTDPDTEPDWSALDEPAPQVRDTPLAAMRSDQPGHLTPATWSSSPAVREALDAAAAMRRKTAGVEEPGALNVGGLVSSEALKVARRA